MVKEVNFISTKYSWGWSVWIEINGSKTMIASKLSSEKDVEKLIDSIKNSSYKVVEKDGRNQK